MISWIILSLRSHDLIDLMISIADIVKLGSLVSLTEWSNISERNSKLIENLKKGPELTL